jgi:hypothetical protein
VHRSADRCGASRQRRIAAVRSVNDIAVARDLTPTEPTPFLFVGLGLLAAAFVGRRLSRTRTG